MSTKPIKKAPAYLWIIPHVAEVAHKVGYAIAVHGSINRDLDLMAMPWIEEAVEPEVLVEEIRKSLDGIVHPTGTPAGKWNPVTETFDPITLENPSRKPHGRLSWNIHLECGLFIDLSVMPKVK